MQGITLISIVKKYIFLSTQITYRPFDIKWGSNSEMIERPREGIMKHLEREGNIGLLTARSNKSFICDHFFVSKCASEAKCAERTIQSSIFPLYLYPDSSTITNSKRTANLNMKLLQPVLDALAFSWIEDGTGNGNDTCGPEDIFDYIYAVLHSPTYRERYKEFLKIDFPRVPFTKDAKMFWKLVAFGRELRLLHLMDSSKLDTLMTTYSKSGTNAVEKLRYEDGKVWINAEQYFGAVPNEVWNFPIGGYLPAQKWLKDRKGRTLSSDDILHYQRVIVALVETRRLMQGIDGVCSFPMSEYDEEWMAMVMTHLQHPFHGHSPHGERSLQEIDSWILDPRFAHIPQLIEPTPDT